MLKKFGIGVFLLGLLAACGDPYRMEDFQNADAGKGEAAFRQDVAVCDEERDKHSHKIQGREFGFTGSETGFLGCMQLRGWERR